jgi:hypothetical protein
MTRLLNLNGQEYVEWIASVNEGDFVDCIKIDRVNCKSCWSRARVMYRTSTDLSIRFLNEKNRALDRIVSADSAEIMPAKSRTPNYDALLNLKLCITIYSLGLTISWMLVTKLPSGSTRLCYRCMNQPTNTKNLSWSTPSVLIYSDPRLPCLRSFRCPRRRGDQGTLQWMVSIIRWNL